MGGAVPTQTGRLSPLGLCRARMPKLDRRLRGCDIAVCRASTQRLALWAYNGAHGLPAVGGSLFTREQVVPMAWIELHTQRLCLRTWQPADLRGFAELNGDPQVMRYFPSVMSRAQSDAMARRMQAHFVTHGFGYWVLERHGQPGLIGVLGLQQVRFEAVFSPAVEMGWRLQPAHWRQGYALEAATAVMACAFEQLQLEQVLAFTVPANLPSQALMQCLGMHRDPAADFEHPLLPARHPLRPQRLYRLTRGAWLEQQNES
jgi:RimJ/RimL family protein N-acetyltransferase